jgi:predicted nuclease of restriction endonuclease-like (RecB) superfamily
LDDLLYERIVSILEEARGSVVRAVNTSMVLAYWLIGKEIVNELQGGEERAEYGKKVIEELSARLTRRYQRGFSVTNLWYFKQFYLAYPNRIPIPHPPGGEMSDTSILHPTGGELQPTSVQTSTKFEGFSPHLSWSHYRALMRVEDLAVRAFYEQEAADCGWSKAQLERQIHTAYYQRIVTNRGQKGDRLPGEAVDAGQMLKAPYVLEFLGIPDARDLHESALEEAIINNLQSFLLELGKGFSFVARQKHIRFDDEDFYVDLVFYNYVLKCFLLIDLKMGKLTHADVGQMDGYVRLYEDRFKVPGDNPTIGLILCADRSEAVAKYSVLNEGRRIFASKYLQFLPSEEELSLEIAKERRLIEVTMEEKSQIAWTGSGNAGTLRSHLPESTSSEDNGREA